MAAVSVPPSPHAIGIMAARRVPLSNVPNVANSPLRPTANKRGRSQSTAEDDVFGAHPPPSKKQIIDVKQAAPQTLVRKSMQAPFSRAGRAVVPDAKIHTPRKEHLLAQPVRQEGGEAEKKTLETVRQWQQHYRKVFPTYVFYFDNVPDESRRNCSRAIAALGAREEKFFSKDITHVITTRPLPSANERSVDARPSSTTNRSQDVPRTVNPSLLERSTKNLISASTNKFTFDPTGSKRPLPVTHETEFRKLAQVDVLQKARDFGIKLWHLEKLHRVLATILEDGQPSHGHNTRSTGGSATAQPRTNKHNDLTQMMKNEQLHERGERAFSLANAELVELKGPFIYVRDINEKCKPIMVREYEKVQVKEDGEWPQFRSAGIGKCPFVEEDPQSRRQDEEERHREKERASLAKAKVQERAARTRASTKVSEEHMRPPAKAERREPLAESISAGNSGGALSHQLPPPPAASASTFTKPIDSSNVKAAMLGPRLGFVRGEPMASGMQQSSITSAIRSQMISSTAAAPGAKAGTSKEVHGLQRKILERNNGPMALIQSQRMMDIAGTAARAGGTMPRAAKQRAQEKLGYKPEPVPAQVADEESEEEEEVQIVKEAKRTTICRTGTKKEPKPGYCENCKEKFDDFDTHTQDRKHRRFATDQQNWQELDDLLSLLVRPLQGAAAASSDC